MKTGRCILKKRKAAALAVLAAAVFASAIAQDASRKAEPLMIQEQGSFAVGGTVITNAGTYDAINRSPGRRASA